MPKLMYGYAEHPNEECWEIWWGIARSGRKGRWARYTKEQVAANFHEPGKEYRHGIDNLCDKMREKIGRAFPAWDVGEVSGDCRRLDQKLSDFVEHRLQMEHDGYSRAEIAAIENHTP